MVLPVKTTTQNGLLILGVLICQLTHAQTKSVSVTDPRPVAAAVELLETIYGWPITYEDPIAVNESRLEDVSKEAQRLRDPSHPVIIQREGTISFTYKVPSPDMVSNGNTNQLDHDRESAVSDALKSVLAGYNTSGSPETFTITEGNSILHVVPENYLTKRGTLQQLTPVLDNKITVLPKSRSRPDLFREICQSLSSVTGIHVGVGTFPNQGTETDTPTTIAGSDITARSLLNQLLSELSTPVYRDLTFQGGDGQMITRHSVVWNGGPMSWELFYSPGWGYVLNIYQVRTDNK